MTGLSLEKRLNQVHARIREAALRSGRDPAQVKLLAVSKTHPLSVLQQAIKLGVRDFGESYVQEALTKKRQLTSPDLRWHFIGRLQSNKIKQVIGEFALIHSVDTLKLAQQIAQKAQSAGVEQKILLQVNVSGETSKGGFAPEELPREASQVFDLQNVSVQGLMAIPAPVVDASQNRPAFRELKRLREIIDQRCGSRDKERHPLNELSMGMSSDFEVAIEEGSTLVRLGTTLFGSREN